MPESGPTWRRIAFRLLPALAWMGVIFALSHRSTLPTPPGMVDSVSVIGHFTVYFVLAILIWWVLATLPLSPLLRYLSAWVLSVLYGLSDEWHQSFVPGRHPDLLDVLTDAIGAACGLLVVWWITRRLARQGASTEDCRSLITTA